VAGSPDLVDVDFKVEEGPSAQLGGGIGYSETYKFQLNGSYTDANFLGTGQRISVELNGGAFSKVYSLSHTNPYTSIDGVSRTESLTYRDVTQFVSSSSNFSSKTISGGVTFDYPLSEYQYLRVGGTVDSSQLLTNSLGSALQAQQWVQQNGHSYQRIAHQDQTNNEYVFYGTNFKAAEALLGWGWDTRNRTLFADRGMRQTVSLSTTIPGSDVQYWVGNYSFLQYVPIYGPVTYSFSFTLDYGAPLGKTTALPPYRNYFAGGPDDIRGYRESRLGPKDQFGNPYGGNMKVVNRNEIILPMPSKWRSTARVSLFFDMGNVFSTSKSLKFFGPDLVTPANYNFSFQDLKRSAGVSVQWLAPLGLFRFSLGVPLNAKRSNLTNSFGDETEVFQFSIGQAF